MRYCKACKACQYSKSQVTPTSFEFTSTVVHSMRTLELFFLKRNIFKKEEYLCSRANWIDSQETSIVWKAINWFCFCKATLNLFNYSTEFNLGPKIILNSLSPPVHHDISKRSGEQAALTFERNILRRTTYILDGISVVKTKHDKCVGSVRRRY